MATNINDLKSRCNEKILQKFSWVILIKVLKLPSLSHMEFRHCLFLGFKAYQHGGSWCVVWHLRIKLPNGVFCVLIHKIKTWITVWRCHLSCHVICDVFFPFYMILYYIYNWENRQKERKESRKTVHETSIQSVYMLILLASLFLLFCSKKNNSTVKKRTFKKEMSVRRKTRKLALKWSYQIFIACAMNLLFNSLNLLFNSLTVKAWGLHKERVFF